MKIDTGELARLRREREEKLIATSRGKQGLVQSWGTLAVLAGIGAIPATARTLGVTTLQMELVFASMFVCSIPATVMFNRGALGTRAFDLAVAFETTAFLGGALALVYCGSSVVSVFWLWYAAYLFINTIVNYRRVHVPVAIGVLALLVGAYVFVRHDVGTALVAALVGASILATYNVLSKGRIALEASETQRLVLERHLERESIGRDLHDGLGAELAAVLWKSRELDAPELSAGIAAAIAELREVVVGMREAPAERAALAAYLRARLGRITGDRVALTVDAPGDGAATFEPKLAQHLVRAAMEGVRNAVQHGQAKHVTVRLLEGALEIEDDGIGIPGNAETAGGDGVSNLRSRARALGHDLEIRSSPTGTSIRLPFSRAPQTS